MGCQAFCEQVGRAAQACGHGCRGRNSGGRGRAPRPVRTRPQPVPIRERVGDREFRLDARGFWQVHRAAAQTLTEAAGRLRKSKAASELFGDTFVEHYAQSREWEEREFRKYVTDWELARYFEII